MTESLHSLDARDRELLAAFRDHDEPPQEAADRVLEAVFRRVHADAELRAPAPGIPWVRAIATSVAIAAAVLLAIRGVVTGTAALRDEAATVHTQAEHDRAGETTEGRAQVAKPAKPAPATAVPSSPPAAMQPEVAPMAAAVDEPASGDVRPSATAEPRARTGAHVDSAAELAADLRLLATAKRTRDASARLPILRRHAKAHPGSSLAEERDVLVIETLCALGRSADARTHAAAFGKRHPGSAFASRIAKSCVGAGG